MIPLDVVSGGFDMVCNGRRVIIFNEGLEVFSFSIMKSSFCYHCLCFIFDTATMAQEQKFSCLVTLCP